jgi:T5SS/PEP-CTERM-associated repeat protein
MHLIRRSTLKEVPTMKYSILLILRGLLILVALCAWIAFPSMRGVPAPDNTAKFGRSTYGAQVKGNAVKPLNTAARDIPINRATTFTEGALTTTISGSKLNSPQLAINDSVIVQPSRASTQGWNMPAENLQARDPGFMAGSTIQQGNAMANTGQPQLTNGAGAETRGAGGVIGKAGGPALAPTATGGDLRFWGNNSGGSWSTQTNWRSVLGDPADPDIPSVPGAADHAIFGIDGTDDGDGDGDENNSSIGTYSVTVSGNTIDAVGIATATITFNLAGNFTVTTGFGLSNQMSDVTISGSGAMSSGTIDLHGGKFTISQASVSTGDFMSGNGGTLLIHNGGSLTSSANTITSAGFIATVDGGNSKWTNTGLLTANTLNITNGAMVKTDSANIGFGGLNLTGGSFNGGALSAAFVNATANSQLTDTSVLLNAPGNSTLDASTWDISGKFTDGSASFLTIKNGANMASDSAELLLSAGVKVDGSGSVWNNTHDLTIQQSAGSNAGLDVEHSGHVTVGGNLIAFGSASLNNTSTEASGLLVMGRVDVARGGSVNVGQGGTLTSGGGVISRSGLDTNSGFVFGSSLSVSGTWKNTGDFVVGESGASGQFATNDLTVNNGGKVTTTGDFFVGQTSLAPNSFNLNSGGTVMDVNGVLAQGAGVTTNAFVDGTWTNSGKLTVADAGTAKLTIGFSTANGLVSSLDATVGNQAGSNGSVGVRNGSMWKVNGNLILGAGGTGSAFVENGSKLMVTGDSVTLGRDANSNGTLTLDDAASRFDFSGPNLIIGSLGNGTLNIERAFALDRSTKALTLGQLGGSTGTLNVRNANTTADFKEGTVGNAGTGIVLVEDKALLHNGGDVALGVKIGGVGTAAVTGAGSEWRVDGRMAIGQNGNLDESKTSTVTVSAGGLLTVNGALLTIGQETGSIGVLTIDGKDSKVVGTGADNIEIGRFGSGTLQLLNGGQFTMQSVTLGVFNGGEGIAKVDGKSGSIQSTLDVKGALTVGGVRGARGELDITGGGQVIAQNAAIIGRDDGSSGVVMLSGKDSTWNIVKNEAAGTGDLTVGQAGPGTLVVGSNARLSVGTLTVGDTSPNASVTVLTGATFSIGGALTTIGKSGVGAMDVRSGGSVTMKKLVLGDQLAGIGSVTLLGSGSGDTTKTSMTVTDLSVGLNGEGVLGVRNGATFTATGNLVSIGGLSSSITVDGLGSFFSADRAILNVGENEQASMTISNQGYLRTKGGLISNGSVVRVNDVNSKWETDFGLSVGSSGKGFLFIDKGAVTANGSVTVGGSDFGQVVVKNSGSLTVTGGNSIIIGDTAKAELSMFSGSQVSAAGAVIGKGSNLNLLAAGAKLTVNRLSVGRSASDTGALSVDNGHVSANFLSVSKGSTVSVTGGSIDLGLTISQADPGKIIVSPGGTLKDNGAVSANVINVLNAGTVGGSGTINGQLINGGKVSPNDPQTLTVKGDYQQLNGGLLQIAIAGKTMPEFDHLNVTGHIALDMGARLELDFINGFAPKTGDKFDFLHSGDPVIAGDFSEVVITGLAPGFQFVVAPDGVGSFGLVALNDGVSTTVPEPSTITLLLLSVLFGSVISKRAFSRKL